MLVGHVRAETDVVAPRLEAAAEHSAKMLVRLTSKQQRVDELHAAVMADEQRVQDAMAEQNSVSAASCVSPVLPTPIPQKHPFCHGRGTHAVALPSRLSFSLPSCLFSNLPRATLWHGLTCLPLTPPLAVR